MPWWHYLIKNLKKNRVSFLTILWFGCALGLGSAEELVLKASLQSDQLLIEILDSAFLLNSLPLTLAHGFKAEISYTVQLVRPAPLSFMGDIVLKEITKTYIFYKDFFADEYVLIAGEDMFSQRYQDFAELIKALQKVIIKLDLNLTKLKNNSVHWLRVQAKLFPYRLKPPLSLLYFFSQANVLASSWLLIKL